MFGLKIKIDNGRVMAGVKKIASDFPKVTKRDMLRAMQWARDRIAGNYPRGSKAGYTTPWTPLQAMGDPRAYKRTGALGRGWRIENYKGEQAYRLTNDVWYVRYVNGDAYGQGQAGIHRGRWFVAFDVVRTAFDTVLRQYLAKDLRQMIRDAGIGL